MSLINRMLRDLSARESRSGEVLSGIEVPRASPGSGYGGPRVLLLLVLVAAFTAGFWLLLGRKHPPAPAPIVASAPVPATSMRFQFDTRLSPYGQARPAPRAHARSATPASPRAPAVTLAPAPALASPPAQPKPAAPKIAAPKPASAR